MPDFVNALTLMALVAATLEYAIVMRHREERRDAIRWQAEVRESLVSVGSPARHHRCAAGPTTAPVSELSPSPGYDGRASSSAASRSMNWPIITSSPLSW